MNRGRLFILLGLVILAVVVVVIVVLVGGGGGGGDVAGGSEPARQAPTATPIPVTYVVLSTQNLPRGFRITREAIDIELWPIESGVQENAFVMPAEYLDDGLVTQEEKDEFLNPVLNPNSPIGQVTRTRIVRWQPILQSMVVKDLAEAADDVGSQTSAILPSGFVAVSVPIDLLGGVAYALADGDRIDVVVSFLFVDVDETFQSIEPNIHSLVTFGEDGSLTVEQGLLGRFEASSVLGIPVIVEPTEYQRPRLVTQRTIQNALVVHVGEYPPGGDFLGLMTATPDPEALEEEEGEEGEEDPQTQADQEATLASFFAFLRPRVVTLGVRPQDAVALIWAMEAQVPMTLLLRSAADRQAADEPTQAVSLEYMVANYQIARPPRLDYALEPRITEIRSVNAMMRFWDDLWFRDITEGRFRGAVGGGGGQ